ncbi:MAG: hypothetical protein H6508_07600 [Calditrichaeota bacterium]|nr:hypothetical protein [Calditrichota bacterium]
MDEAVEKKIRSLKLKLLMAERELHAASGKWKLGALLKAGHANAMNREVDKVTERLEAKIEKIRAEIAELSGGSEPATKKAKPAEPAPKAVKAAKEAPVKKAAEKKTASKKAPAKKAPAKKAAKKTGKK